MMFHHARQKINSPEPCCFQTHFRSAVCQTFACNRSAFGAARQSFILAVKISDFSEPDADVSRWNIDIRANVAVQRYHEGLTKTHDFPIAFSVGVKVGAAGRSPDG
ncbi:hypothetical protein SDC9_207263 [bioreactor metagenome]|uniref:Uncharacterized protein n=1 Tax=bioreactor metagenome TaxID=1076179 RepID=A0A645J8U3_9ZZZZ